LRCNRPTAPRTWTRGPPPKGVRLDLVERRPPASAQVYGCFPHLGRGVGSRRGIACSDGYSAFLRLLWGADRGAAAGGHVPARISRAAPEHFAVGLEPGLRPALHAFLSGRSARLLPALERAARWRAPFVQRSVARDHPTAEAFFRHGPRALCELQTRHGLRAGALRRETLTELLRRDLHDTFGEFWLPEPAAGERRRRGLPIRGA